MKKTVIIVLIIVVAMGFLITLNQLFHTKQTVPPVDYKNVTYLIEGRPVTLVDGKSEVPAAPGSASMITTQYFGDDVIGDLNNDGLPDAGFILTQNDGGSGTFYYAVVALKTSSGYQGTNGVLLGDRISPQTTEIKNGQFVVNYADRSAGESMAARPSVGMTMYLAVSNMTLAPVSPTR